jgi:hypothetical protein
MNYSKRVNAGLTDRSRQALDVAMELGKDSLTDTINRSIQLYAYVLFLNEGGKCVIDVHKPDGTKETIHILM